MSSQSQPQIILASSSTQRHTLFQKLKIPFQIIKPDYNLPEINTIRKDPSQIAKELSFQKAQTLSNLKDKIILSFQTIVSINDELIPKPKNRTHAKEILHKISNQSLKFTTGVALIDTHKSRRINQSQETIVHIDHLNIREIEWYLSTAEWQGTTAALDINNLGSRFIKKIEGDFHNALGLPVHLVAEQLNNLGYEDLLMPPPPESSKPKEDTGSHLPFL